MELIGLEKEYKLTLDAVNKHLPTLLYGFTGNGKTILAHNVAEEYAAKNNIPVIYMQLYPEMTKNSLIGGETIKDGSIVVEEQSVLKFGQTGAIFVVDECTHTTEPVLLAFNSLIEQPYSTVVGDKIYTLSPKTRFIFCGNYPDHAGNIHLPTSFANRLFIINIGMPSIDTLVSIGEQTSKTPKELLEFVAKVILDAHDESFPISPRNMVTFSTAIDCVYNTGYSSTLPIGIDSICKDKDINSESLKELILSSLMANTKTKSQGPDKVKALLW